MPLYTITNSQGYKNILKLIIPFILVIGCFQVIGFYFAGGYDFKNFKIISQTSGQLCILTFFSFLGTGAIVWYFRKYLDKKSFTSLGFETTFIATDIFMGIIFGLIIMLVGFICLIQTKQIQFINIEFHVIELLQSICIFIFIAMAEELLMRGYILNNLLISFNKIVSLIISSLLFALMHAGNPNINLVSMCSLFVAGLFFGLAYIYTNNLWLPIALHFSWNFFQGTIFGFNVSGKDTYSLLVIKEDVSNIWNGGKFGFEGSVLSILFQIIAIILMYSFLRNRLANKSIETPGSIMSET